MTRAITVFPSLTRVNQKAHTSTKEPINPAGTWCLTLKLNQTKPHFTLTLNHVFLHRRRSKNITSIHATLSKNQFSCRKLPILDAIFKRAIVWNWGRSTEFWKKTAPSHQREQLAKRLQSLYISTSHQQLHHTPTPATLATIILTQRHSAKQHAVSISLLPTVENEWYWRH